MPREWQADNSTHSQARQIRLQQPCSCCCAADCSPSQNKRACVGTLLMQRQERPDAASAQFALRATSEQHAHIPNRGQQSIPRAAQHRRHHQTMRTQRRRIGVALHGLFEARAAAERAAPSAATMGRGAKRTCCGYQAKRLVRMRAARHYEWQFASSSESAFRERANSRQANARRTRSIDERAEHAASRCQCQPDGALAQLPAIFAQYRTRIQPNEYEAAMQRPIRAMIAMHRKE